jgi:H+/Cl- antiporter ClcA
MKKCPYCGEGYPDEAVVCSIDGEQLDDGSVSNVPPRKVIRAGSTLPSLIILLSSALVVVAFAILGGIIAVEGLITGWTYSCGIILNDTTKIYRSSSPNAYWSMIGLFAVGSLVMVIVGPMMASEGIKQYKKTRAQKRRHVSTTK